MKSKFIDRTVTISDADHPAHGKEGMIVGYDHKIRKYKVRFWRNHGWYFRRQLAINKRVAGVEMRDGAGKFYYD